MNNLLSEKWIEDLPQKVADNLVKQNAEIIEIICKRLKSIGDLRPTEVHQLTNSLAFAGADLKLIRGIIAKYTKLNKQEINKIFDEAAHENDAFAEQYYIFRGLAPKSTSNDEYIKNLVRAIKETTLEKYENLSDTYAFKFAGKKPLTLRRVYTQAVDKAIYQVLSGTVDYNTAIRNTVKDLADSGLRTVDFESGVSRRIDSAARMNILDSVRELSQKMLLYNGENYGSDGVELSAHALSAPDHVYVQGRQFSNEEFSKMQNGEDCKDVKGNVYAGFDRPIGRWNCKHFEFPIVIGASEPAHSDSELAALKNNSLKKYSFTQEMRKRERNIRKLKDRRMAFSAAGNELDAKRTQRDLNAALKDYTKFCRDNGFEPKYSRIKVEGYKRISSVDNSVKNDVILKESKVAIEQDVHFVGNINRNIYKCVTEDIVTDKVIITDERIQHIKERHPNDYENYSNYIRFAIEQPDYIIEANKPNSAFILKSFKENNLNFQIILKLSTSKDGNLKNSIITFLKISDKKKNKYLRNKKILYKSE